MSMEQAKGDASQGGSDEEGTGFDQEVQDRGQARTADDREDDHDNDGGGCFLALFPANHGHLGVAHYDEEQRVFELLQLAHDQDCTGLHMLFEQVESLPCTNIFAASNMPKMFG